jgi:aldose 1-epimerase
VSAPSGEQHEYSAGGRDVVLGYGPDEMCGSARGAVLMPWPNRIAEGRYEWEGVPQQLPVTEVSSGSAIHGLVRWASWSAVEREPARVAMELVLHPQPGYPFALRLRVEYRLEERGLVVRTEAENVGDRACPFGAGHHPYLVAPSGRVDDLVVDGEPIGERRLDDTTHRPGGWRIEVAGAAVWADAAWPYALLFTGDLPDIGRRGLAVEPMTCPPQAFRTGESLLRLSPGDVFSGEWGIDTKF